MFFKTEIPIVNFYRFDESSEKLYPKSMFEPYLDPWIAILLLKMRAAIDRTSQQYKYVFIIFIKPTST